jgi:hypothetical protein
MAKTKYGHFIKKLVYNKLPASPGAKGKAEFITWPKGSDLEGLEVSFVWGYHNRVGPWNVGGKYGHVHPYGEVFVFTGLDYDKPNTLGAEVELTLGEDAEEHVISAPSVIAIPKGVPHLPMVNRRVDKPFGFLAISVSGEDKTTELKKRGKAHIFKYKCGDMINRMELHDLKRKKGGNADYIAFWSGKGKEKDFKLNFTWAFHKGTGLWHEQDPHVHPNDEALVFVGLDPEKPDYLGAELEIYMGEEMEKHIINTPTVVIAPKGLVHCPLNTLKVEKPYAFTAICLNTEHETKWLGVKPKKDS